MRRLFAERLVLATGVIAVLMSALFAYLRVADGDRTICNSANLLPLKSMPRLPQYWPRAAEDTSDPVATPNATYGTCASDDASRLLPFQLGRSQARRDSDRGAPKEARIKHCRTYARNIGGLDPISGCDRQR